MGGGGVWTIRAAAPGQRSLRGGKINILNEKNWFLRSTNFKLLNKENN